MGHVQAGRRVEEADQRALVGGSLHRSVGYMLAGPPGPPARPRWLVADGQMAELLAAREVPVMPGAIACCAGRAAGIPRALVTSSERVIMDAVLASLA